MITQEQVKNLFDYNPKTGFLTRKTTNTNRINVGDIAGSLHCKGYLQTQINGTKYLNHRIIYLWNYGHLPEFIDHIDGDPSNNKIKNLRECTSSQNSCNKKFQSRNLSYAKGVNWHKIGKKWRAYINHKGKFYHLGLFIDPEVAKQVVKIKRLELHGEFVNHG